MMIYYYNIHSELKLLFKEVSDYTTELSTLDEQKNTLKNNTKMDTLTKVTIVVSVVFMAVGLIELMSKFY